METLDLGPATRTMTELIVGVRDDQLDAATPCPAYSVGDLAEHIGGLALADAWRDPAAYDGTASAGGVEMPAPVAAMVAMNEVVVHGLDLARATGQEFSVRDEDVATCFAFVEPMTLPGNEQMRNGLFGPEVPVSAGAPALDRLIGAAGRQP
jgi:hypothetical protein